MNFKNCTLVFLFFLNAFNVALCDFNFLLGLYQEINAIYLRFKNSYDIFKPEQLLQMMAPSQWDTPPVKGRQYVYGLQNHAPLHSFLFFKTHILQQSRLIFVSFVLLHPNVILVRSMATTLVSVACPIM